MSGFYLMGIARSEFDVTSAYVLINPQSVRFPLDLKELPVFPLTHLKNLGSENQNMYM